MELGENIKKLLLAGIGTAAVTAEKSKEILDDLVKKGELTVEQGKVLNQELRHDFKEKVKKNVNVSVKPTSPDELTACRFKRRNRSSGKRSGSNTA